MDRAGADLDQMIDHQRRAAVFERPGRHLRFELEPDWDAGPIALQQRGPSFAKAYPGCVPHGERRRVAPQRGFGGDDVMAVQARPWREVERAPAAASPQRLRGGEVAPAYRAVIGGDRHGSFLSEPI